MNKNPPKRQHLVPSSYLEWFWILPNWRDTELFILDLRNNGAIREDISWNLTIERDFYTLCLENWEKDYSIEEFFADFVEKDIKPIINKINNRENITFEDKLYLAKFVVFQEMRSKPRRIQDSKWNWDFIRLSLDWIYENLQTDEERFESLKLTLMENLWYKPTLKEYKEWSKKYENNEKILFENKNNLIAMIQIAPEIADIIMKRQWVFWHIPNNRSFLVSDYPVYLDSKELKWPFSSPWYLTAEYVWMPISKSCYLQMKEFIWEQYIPIHQDIPDLKFIKGFNYLTFHQAHRSIISCSKELLSFYKNRYFK